ncbi:MAG: ACT domain-containing protein [Marinisporobacter sp.]|jgi:ACT domain-containing protein|nr:ACT domain-containing protein [Marinisporobacter sp.]
MKAVVTVIGKDTIGIIAKVSTILAENRINILDISQTILQDYFTMIMIVDLSKMAISFKDIKEKLDSLGGEISMSIKIQHEDIFDSMHKIS